MIEYRTALIDDKPLLIKMYLEEIEDNVERAARFADDLIEHTRTILSTDGEQICGTVSWETRGGLEDGIAEIVSLGVSEEYRRQGIATKLVEILTNQAIEYFSEHGHALRVIFLFMERTNETARNFYKGIGFSEGAEIAGFYPDDHAVIWIKHL
ncbi:N-acetyltransferase [Candidatus Thorarchaeota archaeon]|nr:MAG: N-acetyltransferase [Candidatus Thorarchaeota archaeon]